MKPNRYMRLTRPLRPSWRERLFYRLPSALRRNFWRHVQAEANSERDRWL